MFLSTKTVLHFICNKSFKVFGKDSHTPVPNLLTFCAGKYRISSYTFWFFMQYLKYYFYNEL